MVLKVQQCALEQTGSFTVLLSDSECLPGSVYTGSVLSADDDKSVAAGVTWISAEVSPL